MILAEAFAGKNREATWKGIMECWNLGILEEAMEGHTLSRQIRFPWRTRPSFASTSAKATAARARMSLSMIP